MCMNVDLPEPDGPFTARNSPRRTSRLTPRSARTSTSPTTYVLTRFFTPMTVSTIGAKGRDVLLQFLVEAIALSLIGGGIGIALGFSLAEGMQRWMSWPAKVPANAVAMAFGFAAATGVFFGFYPAQKAARLDPIDALRFE